MEDYSITELQQLTIDQRKQIEENQKLIFIREQRLKDLHQQRKQIDIQNLRNQINERKLLNSNPGNDLEILKEIFLSKEQQLIFISNKLEQLNIRNHSVNQQTESIHLKHSFSLDSLKEESISDSEEFPIQRRSSLSDTEGLLIKHFNPTIEVRDDRFEEEEEATKIESVISDSDSDDLLFEDIQSNISFSTIPSTNLKSLLKTSTTSKTTSKRVTFDPLILLFDAAALGDYELLVQSIQEVIDPSQPNDEGLTALHNAVCASNFECVKYLVEFGCDINYADNDGWTPLHCAASCNDLSIVRFLVEHGACIYATTCRENETSIDKCEREEENYQDCSEYLFKVQNDLGVINDGVVYGLYDYQSDSMRNDELQFKDGDRLIVLRREDEIECEWYWARHDENQQEGYIPRNYLGLYPRVRPNSISSKHS